MSIKHFLAIINESSGTVFYKQFNRSFFDNIAVGQHIYIDLLSKNGLTLFSICRTIDIENNLKICYFIKEKDVNHNILFTLGFEETKKLCI
jgi:hypothetical protein